MAHVRELDPSASPLDHFGYELRRKREDAGLTLKQLGSVLFCSGSLIGRIETTLKAPTREFAERVDAALVTDGCVSRLVGLVLRSQLPTWFQPYADMEAKATYILEREQPPSLWVVLVEAVLYREIGGREVMREQLAHPLSFQDNQSVHIHVLPFAVGQHSGVMGSFNLLRFDDHPDLFYTRRDMMPGPEPDGAESA